jgi:hypothetical protein
MPLRENGRRLAASRRPPNRAGRNQDDLPAPYDADAEEDEDLLDAPAEDEEDC